MYAQAVHLLGNQRYQDAGEVVAILDRWLNEVSPPPLKSPRRSAGPPLVPASEEAGATAAEPGSWGALTLLAGGAAFLAALLAAWTLF